MSGGGGRDPVRLPGGLVDPGLDPVEREPDVGPQVGRVVDEKLLHGSVRGDQIIEELLNRGQVLEVLGDHAERERRIGGRGAGAPDQQLYPAIVALARAVVLQDRLDQRLRAGRGDRRAVSAAER